VKLPPTPVVLTNNELIAAGRLILMRDGAFADETRLTGGASGIVGDFVTSRVD
jgi:hypothetical protein